MNFKQWYTTITTVAFIYLEMIIETHSNLGSLSHTLTKPGMMSVSLPSRASLGILSTALVCILMAPKLIGCDADWTIGVRILIH